MLRAAFTLLVGYVLAAPLTDKISMDLTQTEWTNIWTYVIWLCSGAIWAGIIFVLIVVVAAIVD